jgi:protein Tex
MTKRDAAAPSKSNLASLLTRRTAAQAVRYHLDHSSGSMKPINLRIAEELGVREQRVAAAAISLLDGGATVPFVARYRKEATGALDDIQLRTLEERLRYLRELDERRTAILDSISQQGKLDAALKHAIDAADSKARLEDLYLPYRPKRRTKAQMAREADLEPLAEALLARPDQSPEQMAGRYVEPSKAVSDATAALEGARAILVERFTEDATLIGDPARGSVGARLSVFASSCRQGGARRQVRRLFRI